jgi:hypothetical protein
MTNAETEPIAGKVDVQAPEGGGVIEVVVHAHNCRLMRFGFASSGGCSCEPRTIFLDVGALTVNRH